jgi:Zn-dependent peptidase ImmA (M78 family)
MALPDTFTLFGRKWALSLDPSMKDVWGRCYRDRAAIGIHAEQTPWEERDTVLHELGHAVLKAQGREYGGKAEEQYVQALATGFLHLFRDNPALVQYLFKDKT